MSEQVTCPSGMVCTVRGLKTKEADILANASGAKKMPAMINKLLTAAVETVEDHGPYSAPLDWDRVLVGDRTYLLLQIRKATLGAEYLFKAQCGAGGCNNRFEWEVNLDDMPVSSLTDAQRAAYKNANRYETALLDGTPVFFNLPVGADEKRALALKSQHRDSLVSLSLRMRIEEIQGVNKNDMRKYIEEMPLGVANDLIGKFDEVDCGVETTIEIECNECYALSDVTLPFDQNFFFPTQSSSRKRKQRSLGAV